MADGEASQKSLSGLLNGIAQKVYYRNGDITEELLKTELYPELSHEAFTALHDKMRNLLKVRNPTCYDMFLCVLNVQQLHCWSRYVFRNDP